MEELTLDEIYCNNEHVNTLLNTKIGGIASVGGRFFKVIKSYNKEKCCDKCSFEDCSTPCFRMCIAIFRYDYKGVYYREILNNKQIIKRSKVNKSLKLDL